MMTLTFNLKNNVRNEFLGSNLYRKVVLHMVLGHLVKKLHFDCMHFHQLVVIMLISSYKIFPKVGAMPTKLKMFQIHI